MNEATTQIHLGLEDEEGSNFQENNMSIHSGNLDLNSQDYLSDAQEVLSGEFNAAYAKKYANPKTFLHALWNVAGPSAGAMVACLDIIKDELEGELAGVPAEFRNLPEELITFMYKEARVVTRDVIKFITDVSNQLSQFDEEEMEEDNESHVKVITMRMHQWRVPLGSPQEEHKKEPVRLREHYPEPTRQVPQKGLSTSLPQKQERTRRECNP
jgi:hypothetical protein